MESNEYHNMDGMKRTMTSQKTVRQIKTGSFWKFFAVLLLLILLGGGGYLYTLQGGALPFTEKESEVVGDSVEDIVAAVSQLIVLPEGEEPTVATVTDPEKLKDQPFFENAEAGHKVLMYTEAQKAYLYDPNQNKLIEVAPISIDPF